MYPVAAAHVASDYGLLRGGSELADLSMIAARARSAALRAVDGMRLDERDREALEAISVVLEDAVRSIEFFDSRGARGAPPVGRLAARIDATIDAVTTEKTPSNPTKLAEALKSLAEASRQLSEDQSALASELAKFYGSLSSTVLRQMGHVGETTAVL
jgi:hypothetical protein